MTPKEIKIIQCIADKGVCDKKYACECCWIKNPFPRNLECSLLQGVMVEDLKTFCGIAQQKAKLLLRKIIFKEKLESSWLFQVTGTYGYNMGLDVEDGTYVGILQILGLGEGFDTQTYLIINPDGYSQILVNTDSKNGSFGFEKTFSSQDEGFKICKEFQGEIYKTDLLNSGWHWLQF